MERAAISDAEPTGGRRWEGIKAGGEGGGAEKEIHRRSYNAGAAEES